MRANRCCLLNESLRIVKFSALALAVAALGVALAAAAEAPRRIGVDYEVTRNGTAMIEVAETLEHDGRNYRIRSEWRGKGVYALMRRGAATRSSAGIVEAWGLRPVEFRDQRGDGPAAVARFDWTKQVLVREREGRGESTPLPERAQDRLSFAYGFAFAPPAAKEIRAVLADAGGVTRVRYSVEGPEVLRTAAGIFDALRLVKQREAGDDRGTEIWLAPEVHYLPLRILVIEKDGTRIDQVVTRVLR
jgi:hypothetical protein